MRLWENLLLKAYRLLYYKKALLYKEKENATANDAQSIEDLVNNDPMAAYNYVSDMNKEATEHFNSVLSDRRNIYTTIFVTSGSFLTVALPFLSSDEEISESIVFKFIVIVLFISLFLGLWSAIIESTQEGADHTRFINKTAEAALYVRKNEKVKAIELINEIANEKSRYGSTLDLIKKDAAIKMRKLAVLLFFVGISTFVLWMLVKDFEGASNYRKYRYETTRRSWNHKY